MSAAVECPRCQRELLVSAVSGHYCPGGCGWLNDDGGFVENSSNGDGPSLSPFDHGATVQRSREGLFERCRTLAREERILDRLRALLPEIGLVGEDDNALLIYLAATSRLFANP